MERVDLNSIKNKPIFCKSLLCLLVAFGQMSFAASGAAQKADRDQALIAANAPASSETVATENASMQDDRSVNPGCESRFTKPVNVVGLLKNLKNLLSGEYLLDRRFYSRECLGSITGGDAADFLVGGDGSRLWVDGGRFGIGDDASKLDNFYEQGFSASARLERGEVISGVINISFVAGKGPRPDEIFEVLGADWQEDKSLPPHGLNKLAVAPYGNARLEIKLPSGKGKKEVYLVFYSDGTVINMVVTEMGAGGH